MGQVDENASFIRLVLSWIMLVDICIHRWILSDNNVVFDNNFVLGYLFFIKMEIVKKIKKACMAYQNSNILYTIGYMVIHNHKQ